MTRHAFVVSIVLATLTSAASVLAAEQPADALEAVPPAPATYLQGWIGAMPTDHAISRPDPASGEPLTADLGTLPFGGGNSQRLWGPGRFQIGLEGGGIATWKGDAWQFSSIDGALEVKIRGKFFSIGAFMGGVASFAPHRRFRVYVAAGPSLTWAFLDNDDHDDLDTEDTVDDVSFEPYLRAGAEFLLDNGLAVGLSVRHADDEFDFGDDGTLDTGDPLWLFTLSRRL